MNYLEFKVALQALEDKMLAQDVDVDECTISFEVRNGVPKRIVMQRIITNTVAEDITLND